MHSLASHSMSSGSLSAAICSSVPTELSSPKREANSIGSRQLEHTIESLTSILLILSAHSPPPKLISKGYSRLSRMAVFLRWWIFESQTLAWLQIALLDLTVMVGWSGLTIDRTRALLTPALN